MVKMKTDIGGKPASMHIRAVNKMRSEVVEQIHRYAIDFDVKVGKVRDSCLESEPLLLFSY
jgi:hypothetical protein